MKKEVLKRIIPAYKEYVAGYGEDPDQKITGNGVGHLFQNAVYAVTYEKLGLSRVNYHYCYGKFRGKCLKREGDKAETILLQLQPWKEIQTEEAVHTYYEWLFNYSPWRDIFLTKSVNRLLRDNVSIVDASSPCNVLAGGGIAFRQPWENYWVDAGAHTYKRIGLWNDLVHKGIDPSVALAVVSTVLIKDKTLKMAGTTLGHDVLHATNGTVLTNFLLDNKVRQGQAWNESYHYDGGNEYLFGGYANKIVDVMPIVNKTLENLKAKTKMTNPFAPVEDNFYYSLDEAFEALIDASKNISSEIEIRKVA